MNSPLTQVPVSSNETAVVTDELELMRQWLYLKNARLLDLGCGPAPVARRLLMEGGAAEVVCMDTDTKALSAIHASTPPAGIKVVEGGAESIPYPDASFDGVIMMKSLHHVPVESMDASLREIARVLNEDGILYVSEPVYAGEFNEIVRLFHDERHVRGQAIEAMKRAAADGIYVQETEFHFIAPGYFRDFADFQKRIINATHNTFSISPEKMEEIRASFERHLTEDGAHFSRLMRINVLRKAAAA